MMSVMWRKFPLAEVINNGRTESSAALLRLLPKSKADAFLFSQFSLYL